MHNFQQRRMPARDRELLFAAVRVGWELLRRDGLREVTLQRIADEIRLPGDQEVSERTLRRRYVSPTRLLFGSAWWLPEPIDALRHVLAPRLRPTEGPVWPSGPEADAESVIGDDDFDWPPAEFFTAAGISDPLADWAHDSPQPIALRDLLHDLHIVTTGHVVATGFATNLHTVATLRAEDVEVAAWLAHAETVWVQNLASGLGRLFGFDSTAAAIAARAYQVIQHALEPKVGDLARADAALAQGIGTAQQLAAADSALIRARDQAVGQISRVLSAPAGSTPPVRGDSVRHAPRYSALPHRLPGTANPGST